jgi:hypothetical protein
MSTVPEGGAVPGNDYRTKEAEGYMGVATTKRQTREEEFPWSACLISEVHSWIHRHPKPTDSGHGRKAGFPLISRGRSSLLVPEEIIVYSTCIKILLAR